jgi:hypothetical protein
MASHQHILLYSEPSSPLQQSETAVDKLLLIAKYQLPVVHSPGPLMGGTAPITMASGFWVGQGRAGGVTRTHTRELAENPHTRAVGLATITPSGFGALASYPCPL